MNQWMNWALVLALGGATPAWACSSCGCSLSSDWGSQGVSAGEGWRMDLRLDVINQNQMRSGSRQAVSTGEQELYTVNRYATASLDYGSADAWGVTVSLPYVMRSHATLGDPDAPAWSSSRTRSLGDVRVIGRYTGLDDGTLGLQFGLKLPTGSTTQNFSTGDLAGTPLDRGLQPGTGTTDAIIGVFKFGSLSQDFDYFVQALMQLPLNAKDDYKPGQSLNLNAGLRYMATEGWTPLVQLNARIAAKDRGLNATPGDSGGQTVYLSPGVTWAVTDKVQAYGFVQLPLLQHFNGFQLAPKATVSVGTRIEF
jgi:hypothetical protein